MTRRMVDTEIWKKDWFLDLSIKQKLIIKFLYDNCDCAGIYEISYRTLRNCFNEEITKEDLQGLKQIKFISDNKIFIEDFIEFQYGVKKEQLNPDKSNVHKGIYKSLVKNGILRVAEPLTNPCPRVQVKDKDKVIDIENNIYKENFQKFWNLCPKQTDELKCYGTYINIISEGVATYEEIENGMRAYSEYVKNNEISQKYISSPFNWLNGRRWQDKLDTQSNRKLSVIERVELYRRKKENEQETVY